MIETRKMAQHFNEAQEQLNINNLDESEHHIDEAEYYLTQEIKAILEFGYSTIQPSCLGVSEYLLNAFTTTLRDQANRPNESVPADSG